MAAWGRRLVPLLTPMLVCASAVFQYQTVQNQRETLRVQEELTEIRLAKATCYSFGYAREDVTEVAFDGGTRTCRLTDGDGRILSLRWTEGHWREEILFSLAETPLCCASARGRIARGRRCDWACLPIAHAACRGASSHNTDTSGHSAKSAGAMNPRGSCATTMPMLAKHSAANSEQIRRRF
jgi:hypothetical protein